MALVSTTKLLHVLGASVLFGTGLGIAFFMFMAHRSKDVRVAAAISGLVVIADFIFTASAVVLQPITGLTLAFALGLSPLKELWIVLSIALYVAVGLCWLPVVFIQIRMRDLARDAARTGKSLPREYRDLFRIWFWLGWPAFAGVIGIFALMIWQPRFG